VGNTLEKERDRHIQHLAQLIDSTGADTVYGLFVFVDLLKRKPQGCRQLWLAYSQHHSSLSQTRCDMNIDGSKSFAAPLH
jgi:hypothetical protein